MRNTNISPTAEQRAILADLTRAMLAEQTNPEYVPDRKMPLIERAKAAGLPHAAALHAANKLIAAFTARGQKHRQKLAKAADAAAMRKQRYAETVQALAAAANLHFAIDRAAVRAALVAAQAPATAADVKLACEQILAKRIAATFKREFRYCINGKLEVKFGSTAGVAQDAYRLSNFYRGSFAGWGAHIVDTTITVRPDYFQRVVAKGVVWAGEYLEYLVLDAVPVRRENLPAPVFKVTVLRQGRGNNVSTMTGYAAVGADDTSFGKTVEEALGKLQIAEAKAAA